ncbi:MAG TPA: hypothetical protein VIV58_18535 [Kofleriaceae bacterium]
MDELVAALVEQRDDLASWSVYADALQARSDPRGELISLMLQRALHPSPRLYDAQRRYLAQHAAKLIPEGQDRSGLRWRHGYLAELRLADPAALASLATEPALRFVETVALAIDGDAWPAWCTALATQRWPWRRMTVELVNPPERFELRHLFGCAPGVEVARLELPDDDATTLVWDGVGAPALRRLVLVNAGRVDRLPYRGLREVWLLGASLATPALREQGRELARLIVSDADDPEGENVIPYQPRIERIVDEYRYDEAPTSYAFMLVGQPIERALLERLAARMTGLAQLSVRSAELWWQRRPVTVVQLYGTRDSDGMLPYSLAVALDTMLPERPPIVLVEVGDETARYLAFGEVQARGTREPGDTGPADVVRRAFDIAFGCDPGAAIIDDVRDALAIADEAPLVGSGRGDRILNVIDPRATPLDTVEDEPYDDEEEEEEDGWDEPWQDDLERYEEPVPVARLVVKTDEDLWVEQEQAAEAEAYGEPVPEVEDEPELTAIEVVEHPADWFEFREHWEDRASDPDDEPGEVRWPDPAVIENEQGLAADRQIAERACVEHEAPLDACSWCGAPICLACNDVAPHDPIDGVCTACLAALELPIDPQRGRVVS